MRRFLRRSRIVEFGEAAFPERMDSRPTAFDRWLAWWIGRTSIILSPLRRCSLRLFAAQVIARGRNLELLDDDELAGYVLRLRQELVRGGLPRAALVEAFACAREASYRTLGKRHFPVQLMAAYALLRGNITEMATGEGKSLTGALAAVVAALAHIPVHVVTVNDYLARRDAEEMLPFFSFLGIKVGWIESAQSPTERQAMYACDVTYCVNKDLVFDYLKDDLSAPEERTSAARTLHSFLDSRGRGSSRVLRGLYFAIVDEADSIFIDEARTPLIIAGQGQPETEGEFREALEIANRLPEDAWRPLNAERTAVLTPEGRELVSDYARELSGHWRFRRAREQRVEQALAALHFYWRDQHYIIADDKIQIVDESTGRVMPDRHWEHGLHQLIECKEGLAQTDRRSTVSRMTYQRFFSRYIWLAGMSGTSAEVAGEVRSVYGIHTIRIPTHRPVIRRRLRERVFLNSAKRWEAVVASVEAEIARHRAVLVGTRSVDASEHLSTLLTARGVAHNLLNARHDEDEAAIVGRGGAPRQVTVATNMAGRGTDIKLSGQVKEAGGLHVILTEFHESRRIDRQLFGRAARQGDPGSCESLVALDDDVFKVNVPVLVAALAMRYRKRDELPFVLTPALRVLAQSAAERRNSRVRRRTLQGEKNKFRSLAFAGGTE